MHVVVHLINLTIFPQIQWAKITFKSSNEVMRQESATVCTFERLNQAINRNQINQGIDRITKLQSCVYCVCNPGLDLTRPTETIAQSGPGGWLCVCTLLSWRHRPSLWLLPVVDVLVLLFRRAILHHLHVYLQEGEHTKQRDCWRKQTYKKESVILKYISILEGVFRWTWKP